MEQVTHYQSNPLCPVTGKGSTVLTKCGIYCEGKLGKHSIKQVTCKECLSRIESEKQFNYYQNGGANGPTGHGEYDCLSDDETI